MFLSTLYSFRERYCWVILNIFLSNLIDVVWDFAVVVSKILVIMDHVKRFMLAYEGHVLAENLLVTCFKYSIDEAVQNAQQFKLQPLWV